MSLESIPVSSVMVRDVKTVSQSDSLQEACKVMAANKIGSVIMVTGTKESRVPTGILTETDIVTHIAAEPSNIHSPVHALMSHPLVTVSSSSSLREALQIMVTRNIRRLPVVDNERLVGIVSDRDIYRAIARNESLIAALVNDEVLMRHIEELEQPWVYNLGEILHKRLGSTGTTKVVRK